MLRHLKQAVPVCVEVTHFDGFVLARSGFHHSINYRSVMAFGRAQLVADDEKLAALEDFVERLFPGRWSELRPLTAQEIKATTVLRMPLDEVSAKVRTGPPKDDEEDYALPVWAGVLPVMARIGAPQPDARLDPGMALPSYLEDALATPVNARNAETGSSSATISTMADVSPPRDRIA